MRERTSKWDSVKFKFLPHMILLGEWKVKSQTGRKTIKHVSDLGLIAKMCKGLLKFNNNNSNISLKDEQKIWKTPHQRRYTDVKYAYKNTNKLQAKTTTYHHISIRMAKIQNIDNTRIVVQLWNKRNSHSFMMRMQNVTVTLKVSLAVSYKAKYNFTMQPSNHTPRYLSKWVKKLYPHSCISMYIFRFVVFIISWPWKQPRCSSISKWTKTVWYIQWSIFCDKKVNNLSSCKYTW